MHPRPYLMNSSELIETLENKLKPRTSLTRVSLTGRQIRLLLDDIEYWKSYAIELEKEHEEIYK